MKMTAEMMDLAQILAEVGAQSLGTWRTRKFSVTQSLHTRPGETMDWAASSDREYDEKMLWKMREVFGVERFLTEEGAEIPERNYIGGRRVVQDVPDGTSNYARQRPDFSLSTAIETDGVVELAGIITPARGELVITAPGMGTWFLNCYGLPLEAFNEMLEIGSSFRPVRVNEFALPQKKMALGALATASCYVHTGKRRNFELAADDPFNTFYAKLGNPGCTFCCSVALVEVALGKMDGAVVGYQNYWDFAAGQLLVREAGGKFFAFSRHWKRILGPMDFAEANATKTADGDECDEWLCHIVATRTPELAHAIINHFAGTAMADRALAI